jgi:serine/threonine-protein kinase RsbW
MSAVAEHAAGSIALEISASVDELGRVRAFVRQHAAQLGADDASTADMVQAVDECVTNIIVHGYRDEPGWVRIEMPPDDHDLVVRLSDDAPPFDPTQVPAPDVNLPLRERRGGGMGVFLARDLTDRMSYRRTATGNELTLVKTYRREQGAE